MSTFQSNEVKIHSVGWVKADTKAIQAIHDHVITHNPRVSVSHNDHTTWNLHIRNVQEEDRGQYMCQINTDPMKSQVGFKGLTMQCVAQLPALSMQFYLVFIGLYEDLHICCYFDIY
ncbi:hypothetical protein NQ314_020481 [Rhamnusium bicolor]|uniref:Immunoglobulin-like beta-sandwich domain-containing protein n=1 Tax=Rhamnusium bicolor TaxID=1586634 RepID=A0AAV8WL03_9CUCU|nr:hypothetical protein NQ314_020481 [Rhamnusium bicolor]